MKKGTLKEALAAVTSQLVEMNDKLVSMEKSHEELAKFVVETRGYMAKEDKTFSEWLEDLYEEEVQKAVHEMHVREGKVVAQDHTN